LTAVSGKYRLETRLGGGGMAEVFLGYAIGAEGFTRRVAIKRVLPGYSDNDAFARMFVAEAQITSQLVHPNIVSVLDFDRDPENRLFLVMELVEGKDLDGLTSTGLLPFPVVMFIISEVLRGLGHAHDLPVGTQSRGVVHRDISPHNVLLSWLGAVKVSDFGIAKARAASEATASEFIKGKPAYMSPEQANGQPLDGRSDLFAVGVMLWEMTVGRRLFVAEDTRGTLAAVLFGQIPRPRSLRGDVPKDLERVIMKLLERDLPLRYATAEEALHDLLECADMPKAGREALVATLSERFPGQAPMRQSLLRAQQSQPPQPAGQLGFAATAAGPYQTPPELAANTRPAAALSLGSMRNAPTGTLDHGHRRSRSTVVLILLAVAIAAGAIAFGIAAGLKGGTTDAGSAGSQVAVTAPPDAAKVAEPPPAPPDAPPPAPADAAIVAPPLDAKKDAPPVQVAEKRYGSLFVSGRPVMQIFVNNVFKGETAKTLKLTVGKHTVVLKNEDAKLTAKQIVTIEENKVTKLEYPW
jgi:serine/threonine protein kinase